MPRLTTWTETDEAQLLDKRDRENKTFAAIATELQRPLNTCWRRYKELTAERDLFPPPAPEPAPPKRIKPLHRKLGIKTHVHRQAVLADQSMLKWDDVNNVGPFNHLYRVPVSLAGAE